jgi:hypothetical protein
MEWLLIGVLAVAGLFYLSGRNDGKKDGWAEGINYMDQKEQAKLWMDQMSRHMPGGGDEEE